MIDNKWFCEPNDERESWCFLILEQRNSEGDGSITGWQIGYGNPKKMTRTLSSSGSSEEEIIQGLLDEIYYCRREGILMITAERDSVPALRTHILLLGMEEASFRGVEYVCIDRLLEEHFLGLGDLDGSSGRSILELGERIGIVEDCEETELLRRIFLRIGPLLPKSFPPR
ncbi:hypothetical protein AKJ58_00600 [candidate division MSBL1 archaeon SCGC-AAA385D11]|uniref:Uncharacterized protein n=1 Tax=candidate division MSBL1 archaeon SCGC-AAA385D11 TaxID=1698286 RepID=A0A133VP37_9EURY|nr:hypothetical protein AKJ58_00600 [candidate division MSBL1 archaeon SCGC-AAA385D11]